MIQIQYPEPSFKILDRAGKPYIFDEIRKKWLLLQEEEWVRQNFVQYLVEVLHYPKALIALEKEIQLGELKKRFDILVYDVHHQPWMLVECKSKKIELTQQTLNQVLRYHISMPASHLIITNGNITYGWEKKNGQLLALNKMPKFKSKP